MDWAARELEQMRVNEEHKMMEKEINRVRYMRSELDTVDLILHGKPLCRMLVGEAERAIRAQWADGLPQSLRTRCAWISFMDRHRIQYELLDGNEEAARLDAEAHKRMKAGALLRRKYMARSHATVLRTSW